MNHYFWEILPTGCRVQQRVVMRSSAQLSASLTLFAQSVSAHIRRRGGAASRVGGALFHRIAHIIAKIIFPAQKTGKWRIELVSRLTQLSTAATICAFFRSDQGQVPRSSSDKTLYCATNQHGHLMRRIPVGLRRQSPVVRNDAAMT